MITDVSLASYPLNLRTMLLDFGADLSRDRVAEMSLVQPSVKGLQALQRLSCGTPFLELQGQGF